MPYITDNRRVKVDGPINELITQLRELGWNEGDMNYTFSRVIGAAFEEEMRYHTAARIIGVLSNVATEFERRLVGPYEDSAIEKNGDVPEYARVNARFVDATRERLREALEKE